MSSGDERFITERLHKRPTIMKSPQCTFKVYRQRRTTSFTAKNEDPCVQLSCNPGENGWQRTLTQRDFDYSHLFLRQAVDDQHFWAGLLKSVPHEKGLHTESFKSFSASKITNNRRIFAQTEITPLITSFCVFMLNVDFDYTTIQRMTIRRLTKWRPDFDILMIQRLFFLKKKGQKFFSYPSRVSLKDFSYPLRVPERTYTTPHGVFLPLAGADF